MNLNSSYISEEFADHLKKFVFKRVSNTEDAQDILQEVYYKIFRSIDKLNDERKLQSWIFQIARNVINDYYRASKKEEPLAQMPEIKEIRIDDNNNAEIAGCLTIMIQHLPVKYSEAIILTEYEGLTQKQLAEFLGLSYSGAKSRVQRAQKRLKKMLCDCCSLELDRRGNIIDYRLKAKNNEFCNL
ncbi:RNA polymerase sigma factor SigZ [Dendrosporobacter sp. 1207_IL3150]|uniref:RNA polymerase sigma factor SigZ n=1 Tax=Dendrosporobacter sp. 1207_IL3150 TaxID=3084054 RepID=UPI002FD89049